jgi:rhamnogalacturonan endolyase
MHSFNRWLISAFAVALTAAPLPANQSAEHGAVSVSEDARFFTMDNGILAVRVSKESGDLVSMKYRGRETLTDRSGHPFVYWSHDVKGGESIETRVSIDPAENGGERAEVSVKGISGGKPMGHGPGAPPEGDVAVDIDIRYSLGRGDSGVYAYTIFEHRPEYPEGDFTEARLAAKLDPGFTHLHVDEARSGRYPLIAEGADKYIYTAVQFDHRAYGGTNPADGLGWWMLIPSPEFLSAGPNQPEFLVHGELVVFCYWRSSHYGHATIALDQGEHWSKVIGPIFMYVNEGPSSEAMWDDAKARLRKEEAAWPYDWVRGIGYAPREERATVEGQIVLNDSLDPHGSAFRGTLTVGLTKTPYDVRTPQGVQTIDWQHDAKYYQHWVRSESRDGRFAIPHVPAGRYNLFAFADGVLGELFLADVDVQAGAGMDLGPIEWTPARHGRQLWEIGSANRTAAEFAGSEKFWHPGAALRFPKEFPSELVFEIGKSDPATDWFYAHMPYLDDPQARIRPFFGISGETRDASRTIVFELDEPVEGRATLRVALTGTGSNPRLNLSVNGEPLPRIDFGRSDGALTRHQMLGDWREQAASFDAALLRPGRNTLTLTVPKGSPNDGVIYDYLRLEIGQAEVVRSQ